MRFPPSFLEEIKLKLPVSEVVRRRVKLTKAGREWKGLSPFNKERTPSFFVNDAKMAWFDLSAGKNGNIFDFLMLTEGLSFIESVERLATDAGLALPVQTKDGVEQEKKRASLHEALDFAMQFFRAELRGRAGAKARAYLAERQLTAEVQAQFQLGYAPNEKYALRDHLASKGVSKEVMIEAGLLIHGEDIPVPYDRFRDRLMFPIHDRSGRVIAFGGRTLNKDGQPKYLNSPETSLFHKGAVLYNHHQARKAAHDRGGVIAVEGYIDVIAMATAGFPETVAPLGTALTADQCEILWQMAETPVLCFDGDKAGRKAAFRAMDLALPLIAPGRSLRFALLPEGQDPDDLLRHQGQDAVADVLGKALPLADLLWLRETETSPLATPEQKAKLERRLETLSLEIKDIVLQRYYLGEFRARLKALFTPQRFAGSEKRRGEFMATRPFKGRLGARSGAEFAGNYKAPLQISPELATSSLYRGSAVDIPIREALILLLLLRHPGLIEAYYEEIAALEFENSSANDLRNKILDLFGSLTVDPVILKEKLASEGFEKILQRLDNREGLTERWYLQSEAAYSDAEENWRQVLALYRKTKALHKELQLAKIALGNDPSALNLSRVTDINAQIMALTGTEAVVEGYGLPSGRSNGAL